MKKRGLFDNALPAQLAGGQRAEPLLEGVLNTLERMQDVERKRQTPTCYQEGESGLYEQNVGTWNFGDWLYDTTGTCDGVRRELKKELARRIEKSRPVDKAEYQNLTQQAEREQCHGELVVLLRTDDIKTLYVGTPERFLSAKRWYLAKYVPKSEFVAEAIECFENLYFHEDVKSSLHTLRVDFDKERPLIVVHLNALDQFAERFLEMREAHANHDMMCEEFQKHSPELVQTLVECSPESNQTRKHKLDKELPLDTGMGKRLVCYECHTKLKWNDKNMDKDKQDRIHFSPGWPDIQSGKVLIAFIGRHQ